jgi:hypothetical protein
VLIERLQNFLSDGWIAHHRGKILLASLISLVIISPALDVDQRGITFAILSSIVFVAGQLSLCVHPRVVLIGLILGSPYIAAVWVWNFTGHYQGVHETQLLSGAAFYGYIAVVLLRVMFRERHVTGDNLFGAAAAYMLVAAAWGFLYALVEYSLGAEAFAANQSVQDPDLFYFSIVTLTTLGYGDITPVAPIARALAAIEAMVGVMFIAVIVSRLVGMHTARLQIDE